MTKYVNNDLNLEFNKTDYSRNSKNSKPAKAGAGKGRVDGVIDQKVKDKKLFRTAIVSKEIQSKLDGESKSGDYLRAGAEIEALQEPQPDDYLDRRIEVLNSHIAQLRETFESNERKYNLETLESITKSDELTEKCLKFEKLMIDLNKEILKQRIQFEQYEYELHHENEKLRRDNFAKANQLGSLECGLEGERKEIERKIEKNAIKYSSKYKEKYREREQEEEQIKQKYRKMQEDHMNRVKSVHEEIHELKAK